MHPSIQHQLTDARVAGRHSQAGRQQIVRAARRARHATQRPAAQPAAGPLFHHVRPTLLTSYGRRRHHSAVVAQAPHGQRA